MAPPGRRKIFTSLLLPLLFLLFLSTATHAASAVLGIDLGTEYFKAAIAKPGSPIEIVLSKDSKRKEAATLAFKPSRAQAKDDNAYPERLYGGDAAALSSRFPADVYPNLKSLLGLEFSADHVKTYGARYPGVNIESVTRDEVPDKDTGTVGFRSQSFGNKNNEVFMLEELLAMQLKNVKSNADAMVSKGVYVTDVVITHPAYYTAEEKRAIELAADLAGFRVLGLVSDGIAVGINYATARAFESVTDGAKPEYHLIYDMGAGSTTATVVKFQGRTVKGPTKRNSTIQEVIALGTGFDVTLGGDSLNDVVVGDIVAQFVNSPKVKKLGLTTDQVTANGKVMARIWKDAERIRQHLSANAASGATFEGLYDEDITFKYSLTRDKFEELIADFTARVGAPIETALQSAGLQLEDLDSIILHGGAVRTPFVQKQLEKVAGDSGKLKSNVNADEAAVMGAAFKAASLSPSFRVKDIRDTDISGFAYSLRWTVDNKAKTQKLFTSSSQVGVDKQVPVKAVEDLTMAFSQTVNQVEVPILEIEVSNLTKSVAELKEKHGCAAANISTTFTVRLSLVDSLPEVVAGSVSCEIEGSKGTVMDNVKGLFGFGSKKDGDQKILEERDVADESADSQTPLPVSDPTSSGSTISSASPSPAESSAESASTTKPAKASKATPSVVAIPLSLRSKVIGLNAPPTKTLFRIRERMIHFDASDRNAVLRAEALNNLEAFTYRARDYLEDESFIASSSDSARKELQEMLSTTSEWLYADGLDAKLHDFKDKLKSLRGLVDPVLKRKDETHKRPDAVKTLKEGLENIHGMITMVEGAMKKAAADAASSASQAAAASATSSPSASASASAGDGDDLDEDPYQSSSATESAPTDETPVFTPYQYTEEDLSALTTKHAEVQKWFDERLALQEKLGQHDDPAFLAAELEAKGQELQKLVSDTIMKTIKMPDLPRKSKTSGGKKGGKGKAKKNKSSSSASGSGSGGSTAESSASSSTTTLAAAKGKKTVKDEL